MSVFYLGTWQAIHLERARVPLFISYRWLMRNGRVSRFNQRCPLAVDSGGFTQLSKFGEWTITPEAFVEGLNHLRNLGLTYDFIAQQDWMCEPHIIEKTGLSVREHQTRTVENYIRLIDLDETLPFIPVLQGYELEEYMECLAIFEDAGVDLAKCERVGLGSVCRRQSSKEIGLLIESLSHLGLRLHGFGIKKGGLERSFPHLLSADSMAWSYEARRTGDPSDRNSLEYALEWRDRVLEGTTWN